MKLKLETIVTVISMLIAVGAFIRSAMLSKAQSEKYRGDVMRLVSETALDLLEPLRIRVDELERLLWEAQTVVLSHAARIALLEKSNKELYNGATRLTHQVMDLGAEPVYIPPEGELL